MPRDDRGNAAPLQFPMSLIEERLADLQRGQGAICEALKMIVDQLQAQAEALGVLNKFAREDPPKSPVNETLRELVVAIIQMDGNVTTLAHKFDEFFSADVGSPPAMPHPSGKAP